MRRSIIVAMSLDRVIGRDGGLPWRLPADLKQFKRLTLGHHLLVGRRTFESIGRPLPGREMVLITRREDYRPDGVRVAHSIDEALGIASAAGDDEAFIGGGAEIFRATLDVADRIYLTLVRASIAGDTLFPEFDLDSWSILSQEDRDADQDNPHALSFITYCRRGV
jgi:dihydrofolate reductase